MNLPIGWQLSARGPAALLLAGCAQAISVSESGDAAQPQVQPAQSPDEVAAAFLNAWNAQDLDTMYSLISPQSRELYADEVFKSRYTVVNQDIGFNSVTPTIRQVSTSTTAIVNYDAKIESAYYGTIDDPGRTMQLVQTPEGWRIAWTTMDIFEGLVGGSALPWTRASQRAATSTTGTVICWSNKTGRWWRSTRRSRTCPTWTTASTCWRLSCAASAPIWSRGSPTMSQTIFYLGEVDLDTYTEWQDS
jgi:hypothetical protein